MSRWRGAARRLRQAPSSAGVGPPVGVAENLEPHVASIVERCLHLSLTGAERLAATVDAVEYVTRRSVPGALAECGVWRGGSVLAMILTLQHHGVSDRDLYLYDTFEGMTEPTDHDTSRFDAPALRTWRSATAAGQKAWEYLFRSDTFGREHVERLLFETGYPEDRIHIVQGKVEDTIPEHTPDALAVLRLDTDWYESTRHELVHLYPRLAHGGVLIIDDYGHWEGARRAVDEYFESTGEPLLLARTDYAGRTAVKV